MSAPLLATLLWSASAGLCAGWSLVWWGPTLIVRLRWRL